jgi:hypothetical protein
MDKIREVKRKKKGLVTLIEPPRFNIAQTIDFFVLQN